MSMKKTYIISLILSILAVGCATTGANVGPQKTQLQIREFQTRSYETNDFKMVMKAVLNVLQDEGFIVKDASVDLGLISATMEVDAENKSEKTTAIALGVIFGFEPEYTKNAIIECSVNISEFGTQTRVRVNFQMKVMNNVGKVLVVKQVQDEKSYQEFFSKVDKGIFIQKEKL